MQEIINKNVYKIGHTIILHKFPQAKGVIQKVNKTNITVLLISCDKSVDGRIFNVKLSDIETHYPY